MLCDSAHNAWDAFSEANMTTDLWFLLIVVFKEVTNKINSRFG